MLFSRYCPVKLDTLVQSFKRFVNCHTEEEKTKPSSVELKRYHSFTVIFLETMHVTPTYVAPSRQLLSIDLKCYQQTLAATYITEFLVFCNRTHLKVLTTLCSSQGGEVFVKQMLVYYIQLSLKVIECCKFHKPHLISS